MTGFIVILLIKIWASVAVNLTFLHEGLDGGSGIHYSFKKNSPLFISLKFWVIHLDKTHYPLTVKKVAKKSDYSLFIIFFLQFIKKIGPFIIF